LIKIGCAGLGVVARKFYIPSLLRLSGKCEIVACSGSKELYCEEGYTCYPDIDAMLANEELDAVIIFGNPGERGKDIISALAKCHVLCEMPMTLDYLEVSRIFDEARYNKKILMLGENRFFAPTYMRAKEITDNVPPRMMVLQKCRHALDDMEDGFAAKLEDHVKRNYRIEGTPMLPFIVEFLNMAEWFAGPITGWEAESKPLQSGMQTNIRTNALLKHKNDTSSMLNYDEFGSMICEHLTLHASGSTYIVRGSLMQPNQLLIWSPKGEEVFKGSPDPLIRGGFAGLTENFITAIEENERPKLDTDKWQRIMTIARGIDGSGWWL
jgi:predicted dehydrogenase